jgi:hypothetical protein
LLRPDCELRLERDDPRFEREPALLEPELPDFDREFPDRDPEFARAIVLLPWSRFLRRHSRGRIPVQSAYERLWEPCSLLDFSVRMPAWPHTR